MHTLCFSQSQKILLERMKKALVEKPTYLTSQVIIVGSTEMKKQLIFSLAIDPDIKVVSGIKVLCKEDIGSFLEGFFSQKKNPSRMEVSLSIEDELKNMIEKNENHSLINLIKVDGAKRLPLFSENLSEIFMKYLLFSPDFFSREDSLLSKLFSRVSKRLHVEPADEKNLLLHKVSSSLNVHFFCCRYFPPSFTRIFKALAKKCRVFTYTLSPSEHYWEDFLSDDEEKRLLKKIKTNKKAHREAFAHKHPLLANFGVIKREHIKNLSDDLARVEEYYPADEPYTFLEQIKLDLLQIDLEKKSLSFDDSLLVVKAKSKLEEVLAIKELIEEYSKDFSYDQMAIYVPDIDLYAPFLEMVFGIDIKGKSQKLFSAQYQGALDLLQIIEGGIEIEGLQSLLFNPHILEKQQITKEEAYRITRWLSGLKMDDGFNLEKIDRLLLGLIYCVDKEEFDQTYPLFGLEMGDTDLINKLIIFLQRLKEDVDFFQKKRRAGDFLTRLKEIETFYFLPDEMIISSLLENFSYDWFLEENIPSESVLYRMKDLLEKKKGSFFSLSLDMPTICCSKNSIATSFPIIFVLGVSESFYSYQKDPLDPMQYTSYVPSQKDQDYAFFLEVLLLASEKLIFSYFEKQEGENPALLLSALFSYLDLSYLIDDKKPSEMLIKSISQIGFEEKKLEQKTFDAVDESQALEKIIRAEDLIAFAKHPIKYYFQRVLRLDVEKSPIGQIEKIPDVTMGPRDKALFRYFLLDKGFEGAEREFEKQDLLPDPFLYRAIVPEFNDLDKQIDELFEKFSLSRDSFSKTSLWENPLELFIADSSFELVGFFQTHEEGFILPEDKIEKVVSIWPVILLDAIKKHKTKVSLFFIKEKKKRDIHIEDPKEQLTLYLSYFLEAKKNPSPMLAYLAQTLLYKDLPALVKKAGGRTALNYEDPYLELFFSQNTPEEIFVKWSEKLKTVFSTVIKSYEEKNATV